PPDTRLPCRGAPGWQHASRVSLAPAGLRRWAPARPFTARTPERRRPPRGSRAAFATVELTNAYAALVSILRVPEPRDEASAQGNGPTAAMGKLLAGTQRFSLGHPGTRPHGRPA